MPADGTVATSFTDHRINATQSIGHVYHHMALWRVVDGCLL